MHALTLSHNYLHQGGYVFTLFVCLVAELRKSYSTNFHKFGGKVVHWPLRNTLDFGGNPDNLYIRVRVRVGLWLTFHVIPVRTVLRLNEG